jgi:hypothetical protein
MRLKDWNDREVEAGQSKGGVLALADFSQNLMRDDGVPWPPAAVVQKLYESRQARAFPMNDIQILTRRTGYYSDLQSINSEDAITWSFFGTLASATETIRASFLDWLLQRLRFDLKENSCSIDLWKRIPHPDTLVPGGPEIDVVLTGTRVVVFGEAKWMSPEGRQQGKMKDKGQLQLRMEFFEKYGRAIYGSKEFLVLAIGEELLTAPSVSRSAVFLRALLWSDLAEWPGHPQLAEFRRYHAWKRRLSARSIDRGSM